MITFYVDDTEIKASSIAYHFQAHPFPGGHKYMLKISLDEVRLISSIEKAVMHPIKSNSFFISVINSMEKINIINRTINYLEEEYKVEDFSGIHWVFNNIEKVHIINNDLVLYGTASRYIENFATTRLGSNVSK